MEWEKWDSRLDNDCELYQVLYLFNDKNHKEIDFHMDMLPLNLVNEVKKKRLFQDDIEIIVVEVPQLSKPAPTMKNGRRIKGVTRKRKRKKKARHLPFNLNLCFLS